MEQYGKICILVRSLWLQCRGLSGGKTTDSDKLGGCCSPPGEQYSSCQDWDSDSETGKQTEGTLKRQEGWDTVIAWIVRGWERWKP